MPLGDPFNFNCLSLRLNRDFDVGFHKFDALVEPLLSRAFDNSLYSVRHFDLDETENEFVLTLELPGFKQADVDVTLEKEVLTVNAKRGEKTYVQSVIVPKGVDSEKIEARLEDGLLVLKLGKQALAKPRKIAIK